MTKELTTIEINELRKQYNRYWYSQNGNLTFKTRRKSRLFQRNQLTEIKRLAKEYDLESMENSK